MASKEFTGLVLEGDAIKIARVKASGKKLKLLRLDRFSLVEEIKKAPPQKDSFEEELEFATGTDADSIFGLEEDDADLPIMPAEEEEEIDFGDLEAETGGGGDAAMPLDMVEESGAVQSNEILLYNLLAGIGSKRLRLGLNIPAGNAIFQIIRDINFKEVKKKDLIGDLEGKLQSIYGMEKSPDNYAYEIREDGSLLMVSVDDESPMLQLLNRTRDMYSGKVDVEEIYPDEIILTGLARANYDLAENEITGMIQFGPRNCRIVFLKGYEIWQVSPIINEGTKSKTFLNTVFSKILFQLDTGEVPNLDRIILANNSLGSEAIGFFQKNFSDIAVSEFRFDENKLNFEDLDPSTASSFTTAIGMAWAASGIEKEVFPKISLLPSYVIDRQKIFKLQWHGVLLLLLIFVSPLTFNYLYQQNVRMINTLSSDLENVNNQITQINPIVESTNQLTEDLSLLRDKLVLLDTLSTGSREWSTKLNILNQGVRSVGSTWITSMAQSDQNVAIAGYTLYRSRLPELVNVFQGATLHSVNIEAVREEHEIYRFTITIKEFAEDRSTYSLPTPEAIEEIISSN